ncbi:MAG TPA: hypothetical protein VF792_07470 [Ktedonobacterales bacterium]
MRTDNYATILSAVGNMLDLANARNFSVREVEHGLTVELVDGHGESHAFDLSVADVAALTSLSQRADARSERVSANRDEGTLRAFLDRHTLVGAR